MKAKRILVVEDEPDVTRIVSKILDGAGYDVVVANGGEDGIRKLAIHPVDLVLTDLAMPKVNGVAVIRAVRDEHRRRIPVVAVTAHRWDHIAEAAEQAGCDGWVSKPFSAKQLLDEVAKHLDRRSPLPA
jgi:CheY-like chemotaxis protein